MLAADYGWAQTQTGEIFGKVNDRTGAVLPGASVTISGDALIQPQSTSAAASGSYRFPNVPIGVYSVTFELAGFKRMVRTDVRIQAGFNAEVNARLELSSVEETVTVTGESPIIDTRSNTLGTNFGKELLEAIPSARDPWVILEQTPGMVMNVQNVGGNASGQQASFGAHGSTGNQQWNLDGATITDMASSSSPGYFDFDSFEEIQITTAGGDASQEASGVAINFVTKSGGNAFRGSGRVFDSNKKFQSSNTPAEVAAQGGGAGNPLKDVIEYGTELGGPIVRDKAWFWGGVSRQSIKVGVLGFLKAGAPAGSTDADDLETDLTVLNNQNLKLNYGWTARHKTTFLYSRGDKIRNARGANSTTRIEATTRQTGPNNYYKGEHQWVASDRLMIEGEYSYNNAGFMLNFHDDSLATVQRLRYVDQGDTFARSGTFSDNIRPTYESRLDGNYFMPGFLGGDHSTKFGVRWRSTPFETISKWGGGVTARIRASGQHEVDVARDGDSAREMWQYSVYFSDSYKVKRTTVTWGLRFDHQNDNAIATTIPANPLLPDLLPSVSFKGADGEAVYNDLAPRVAVAYDLRGTGRTVLKASAARYYGLGIYTAGSVNPTGQTTLSYFWNDVNGDLFVTRNEIDLARGFRATPSANYDPANPSSVVSPNKIDPNLENDITDEFVASVDHELMQDFAVGVSYIRRKYHNLQDDYRNVTADSYAPVTFTANCGNALCDKPAYSGTYYQRSVALPAGTTLRNTNSFRNYHGLEVTARKRFSHNWLLNSSLTLNNTVINYRGVDDFSTSIDPTNFDFTNGRDSSGLNGAKWTAKLSGMYALPWNMSVAAFYNLRDGLQFNRTIQSPNRTGSGGTVNVQIEPQGTTHYPNFSQLDVHFDKGVLFGKRRIQINVDAFNIMNASTVLARQTRQNFAQANFVTRILAPRVVRFGLKVNF
ncbi:MAG: carboxypeptidase-like regulatory domain-containing protein [Acidobacteriota bacterium]|nr:carboxypeptidase-like regulatory domain-containing protein [Acidobacteriota bacterium]